jgi:putative ABC transport system permease protein
VIRNYVRTALRYLFRRKVYSLINILGLAIGLACSILIFLYVRDELSFDRYHANAESIYRLAFIENRDYKTVNYPITSGGIAPALLREVPDVRNAVRFMRPSDQSVAYGEKLFREKRIFYADESVFDVFSFPLVEGDPKAALAEPFTVVIGEDAAEKYFGRENPMGKTLTLGGSRDFRVTGIFREVPRNSHFAFDMLFSIKSLGQSLDEEWRPSSCYTYLLLKAGSSPSVFETTFPDFFKKYRTQSDRRVFYLQPLTRIHLHSNLEREIEPNGNIAYVKILSSVALFVLLIACLNFINLSTARSADRAKEVAVRKVAGAHQTHLVGQFLGESILTALVAVILALALIQILMPAFNRIAGKEFGLGFFPAWPSWPCWSARPREPTPLS